MHFLMLVCALMLAMSTLDTMMNGLASGIATDLAGMGIQRGTLMTLARVVTAVVAIPGIIVATQGLSVLYVFLIADLLGAAIAAPMLVGLYSRRMPGWGGPGRGRRGNHHRRAVLPETGSDLAMGDFGANRRPDVLGFRVRPGGIVRNIRGSSGGPTDSGARPGIRFRHPRLGGAVDR